MVEKRRIDWTAAEDDEDRGRAPKRRGALTLGGPGRIRAEFIKSRRVVRIVGDDGKVAEFDLLDFLELLGIEPADLAPTKQYVLFAGGSERPSGGSGDIAGTYTDEAAAKSAFQRLRMSSDHRWAQLVALDVRGRLRAVAWFGERFRSGSPVGVKGTGPVTRTRRTLRRLSIVREAAGTSEYTTAEARGAVGRNKDSRSGR